jgi:hypothetical protein
MKPVAIQMALANVGESVDAEAVYAFIEFETDDVETYVPAPPPLECVVRPLLTLPYC